MTGYGKTGRRIQTLQGKRISENSLRRELDKIVPGARWDSEKNGRGLVLFSETDSMYITLALSYSRESRKTYVVDRVCVSDTVW